MIRSASLTPWTIEIDDKKFVIEKLTIGDLEGLADYFYRAEIKELNEKVYKDEKERINTINSVVKMSPDYIRYKLLEDITLTIYCSLVKKQPEITIEYVKGLIICDELVQLAFDILDIKRIIRENKEENKEEIKVDKGIEEVDELTKKNVT